MIMVFLCSVRYIQSQVAFFVTHVTQLNNYSFFGNQKMLVLTTKNI